MEGNAGSARDARAPLPNRYRAVSLARAHGTAMGFRAEAHWPSLSRDTGITAGDDPEEPGGPLHYRPSILVSLRTQAPQHSWRPDGKWRCCLGIAPFATALSGRSQRPEGGASGTGLAPLSFLSSPDLYRPHGMPVQPSEDSTGPAPAQHMFNRTIRNQPTVTALGVPEWSAGRQSRGGRVRRLERT